MVKKWIVMIVLAAILIFACIYESKFVNNTFDGLVNSLETLQIELTENKDSIDSDELIKKANKIHLDWGKKTNKLKCIVWHTSIKDIEIGLAKLSCFIAENEYSDAYAEIASLIDYVSYYLDDFEVSLDNIL